MDLAAPVRWYPTRGPRRRLVGRAVLRVGQPGAVVVVLGRVVPEPVLAGLEALDDGMTGLGRVLGRVLHRGRVAAADVPALRAAPQVDPPALRRLALHATGTARRYPWIDRRHSDSRSSSRMGRRTRNRVSPGADSTAMSPWCLFTTIRHEMSRPKPVPSPTGFVVKNGSKMRPTTSSGMPGPVSPISTCTRSPTRLVRMVSVPLPPIACSALSRMFVHTWLSSAP